jgi:TolB-like protein/DNA-binding winged helix-turn-helix (wHTH) protein
MWAAVQEVSSTRGPIRFGVFEVNLRAGELRKQGVKIKLQEQPFQVLQILLEQPGEVVSREELQRRIWPSDTFVGFDQGLYNAVKRLREALGDTAQTPQYIETLPKRGYRFVGTVNGNGHLGAAPAHQAPAVPEPSAASERKTSVVPCPETPSSAAPPSVRSWRKLVWVLLPLVAVAIVFAAATGGVAKSFRRWFSIGTPVPAIHSIAVLPLQNLSGDPTQDYFADAMTEELITELSGISSLKVISRTSVMRYKKSDKSLPEIARELKVDGIVEGSVARNGNEVKVTAQLIYAPEDKNVWARSFERQFQDSLTLQSEVASAIAGAVRAQVDPDEQARLQAARPVKPKALEAYLQGSYHALQYARTHRMQEEADKALQFARLAIAEDPNFARAYVLMADVYGEEGIVSPRTENEPLRKAAVEKALALDPNLVDALLLVGNFKRALELEPNDANAHVDFGLDLISMGRMEEGLKELWRAKELDPDGAETMVGGGLYLARHYDEAISVLTRQVQIVGPDGSAQFWLSESYAEKGRYQEAFEHGRIAAELFGYKEAAESMDRGYAAGGYKAAMRALAKSMEQFYARKEYRAGFIARFYMRAGDKEQAFKWLQKAFEEEQDAPDQIDPVWDPVRSDPRFKELIRRAGLPEVNVAALNTH